MEVTLKDRLSIGRGDREDSCHLLRISHKKATIRVKDLQRRNTVNKQHGTMEDAALIRLFEERREEAVSRTEEAYGPWLRQFSARFLGDPRAREEALANTLLGSGTLFRPTGPPL